MIFFFYYRDEFNIGFNIFMRNFIAKKHFIEYNNLCLGESGCALFIIFMRLSKSFQYFLFYKCIEAGTFPRFHTL